MGVNPPISRINHGRLFMCVGFAGYSDILSVLLCRYTNRCHQRAHWRLRLNIETIEYSAHTLQPHYSNTTAINTYRVVLDAPLGVIPNWLDALRTRFAVRSPARLRLFVSLLPGHCAPCMRAGSGNGSVIYSVSHFNIPRDNACSGGVVSSRNLTGVR